MSESEDQFVQFLSTRRGQNVYLKPYWGNSGDMLIWIGMEEMLRRLQLTQVFDPNRADIVLWPGGNPTMWEGNLKGWQECWSRWPQKEFVVAPATFQQGSLPWVSMLESTTANITGLFARDAQSLQALRRLQLRTQTVVGIGHDPAFELRNSRWIQEQRAAGTEEYVLASFRNDHESTHGGTRADDASLIWPLSAFYRRYHRRRQVQVKRQLRAAIARSSSSTLPVKWQDASLMSFHTFIECVSRADELHTDRLHCMILATLLGKKVYAYPTLYSKLEGVYEQSIKRWAPVTFISV